MNNLIGYVFRSNITSLYNWYQNGIINRDKNGVCPFCKHNIREFNIESKICDHNEINNNSNCSCGHIHCEKFCDKKIQITLPTSKFTFDIIKRRYLYYSTSISGFIPCLCWKCDCSKCIPVYRCLCKCNNANTNSIYLL